MLEYIRFTTRTGQVGKLNVEAFSHWIPSLSRAEGEIHTRSGRIIYVVEPEQVEKQLEMFELQEVDDD